MRVVLNRVFEWKGLVIWVLVMLGFVLVGCELVTDMGFILEMLFLGFVKFDIFIKSILVILLDCFVIFQGCLSNSGLVISEECEFCLSFLNVKFGINFVLLVSVLDYCVEWVFVSGDMVEMDLFMDGVVFEVSYLWFQLIVGDNYVVVDWNWVVKDDKG